MGIWRLEEGCILVLGFHTPDLQCGRSGTRIVPSEKYVPERLGIFKGISRVFKGNLDFVCVCVWPLCSMQDLSSLTRGGIYASCSGSVES